MSKRRQGCDFLPQSEGESEEENDAASIYSPEDILELLAQDKYTLDDAKAEVLAEATPRAVLVRRSRGNYGNKFLNVNLYEDIHFSYIKNLAQYTKTWRCQFCEHLFDTLQHYNAHRGVCIESHKDVYPGGGWGRKPDLFEQMTELGWHVPKEMRFYRYYATFDYEARFKKLDIDVATPQKAEVQQSEAPLKEELDPMSKCLYSYICTLVCRLFLHLIKRKKYKSRRQANPVDSEVGHAAVVLRNYGLVVDA